MENSRLEWQKLHDEIKDTQLYMMRLGLGSLSLALALQGKYLGDAVEAIEKLKESRRNKPTDRLVNLYLGRAIQGSGAIR